MIFVTGVLVMLEKSGVCSFGDKVDPKVSPGSAFKMLFLRASSHRMS